MNIAHRRLVAQRLVGSASNRSQDVVEWLVAVQAQDYAGAKWALGIRADNVADADVEQAFAEGRILRTHVMRPTWHFVAPKNIRWLLMLTAPRVHAANAFMRRKLEIDDRTLKRSNAVLADALRGGRHLTRNELRESLNKARIQTDDGVRLAYLIMTAELEAIICSGPRHGKQFTYALLDERVKPEPPITREDALARLAHRYYVSRGPATVHDFAKWSGLTLADARSGLEAVKSKLEHEVVDGRAHWFAPGATQSSQESATTAHLLSIYDEYISGYQDRSAIVSAKDGARLVAMSNLLTNIILIDGQVRGTWKREFGKNAVAISIDLFGRLTRAENRALDEAVEAFGTFVGLKTQRAMGSPAPA